MKDKTSTIQVDTKTLRNRIREMRETARDLNGIADFLQEALDGPPPTGETQLEKKRKKKKKKKGGFGTPTAETPMGTATAPDEDDVYEGEYDRATLAKLGRRDLVRIAKGLGVDTKGLMPADLRTAILKAGEEPPKKKKKRGKRK